MPLGFPHRRPTTQVRPNSIHIHLSELLIDKTDLARLVLGADNVALAAEDWLSVVLIVGFEMARNNDELLSVDVLGCLGLHVLMGVN